MIGHALSPILVEIEATLIDHEVNNATPPEYTVEAFRAATKIFMSALLDKMWENQERNGIVQWMRESQAENAGKVIRNIVLSYTGIDTHKLYY